MKRIVFLTLLALGMAQAQPTTAAQSTALLGTVTLTDVPADHWARSAVNLMVERGIITGFPDGTFRGEQPLTRYQAALIFSRLKLDELSLTVSERALVQRGMESVGLELIEMRREMAETRAVAEAANSRSQMALSQAGTALAQSQVARTEISRETAARVQGEEALRADIAALSALLAQGVTGGDPVLGEQLALLSEVLAGYQVEMAALARDLAAGHQSEAQARAEVLALRSEVAALASVVTELRTGLTTVTQEFVSTQLGTAESAPIVIGDQPDIPFTASANPPGLDTSGFAFGFGGSYLTGQGLGGMASIEWIPGNVGLSAYVIVNGEAVSAGADARYYFAAADATLRPYLAAGGGVAVVTGQDGRTALPYARGALGIEYALASTLGIWGEIGGNYYFRGGASNTVLDSRFGAKVRF